MEKLRTWQEFLIEQLTDREEAIGYLQVSLEEYLIDGDTPFLLKGIRNVIEAQGGVEKVAKQAGLAPKILSEFLSNGETLQLDTLSAILKAFGWQLSIEPLSTESDNSECVSEQLTPSNIPLDRTYA